MLEENSLAQHNVMLAQKTSSPTKSTTDCAGRPAKRQRLSANNENEPPRTSESPESLAWKIKNEVPDSVDGSSDEELHVSVGSHKTDLETTLPPTDEKAAIAAYQASAGDSTYDSSSTRISNRKWIPGRSSIYVDAFNLALDTVLEDESHLFDQAENAVFQDWHDLSYEAQYLSVYSCLLKTILSDLTSSYVRLFLRKTSSWHRVNRLQYHSDVAHLESAIEELTAVRELPASTDAHVLHPGAVALDSSTRLDRTFAFADRSADHITSLEEASSLLLLDELKTLAKDAKVQGKNKSELVKALRRTSGKQYGLGWTALRRSDTEDTTLSTDSTELNRESRESTPSQNRDAHFVDKILATTGPLTRLSLPALSLFERVHLVFYRSTEWTEKSLTAIILARISRWTFPEYIVCRSTNIFPSRSILQEFEASLRTQFRVDNILEFNGPTSRADLQAIIDISDEILPRWKVLRDEEQQKADSIYASGEGAYLRRLSPAWVYTRIIHKGASVLGKFKEHKKEHDILTQLLSQRLFHTSRRGDWYQRKALLEEHYMYALHPLDGKSEEGAKKDWKRISLQTCEEGLQDPLVHIIYHHDLQKRIGKVERALRVPKREQHDFGHVRLAKPAERTFYGVQIQRRAKSGQQAGGDVRRSTKTIWVDPGEEENGGECSVEAMCLSQYRALGYQGYHSEGGIVRTLFAYLFFDILFLYIPDVFQTPYQTCPLDLHTDAFFPSRLSEINRRLNDISNGEASAIIQRVWDEHHEKRTCVVGLDWTFELTDLLSIAKCFPPAALSTVCKVVAQEYAQRGGGVPDLFLWRENEDGEGEVMFAEVKSENDRLSDTQRLWIDVLSGAGVRVELCNGLAKEVKVVD